MTQSPAPIETSGFEQRLVLLKADLIAQGRRVSDLIEGAFNAALAADPAGASRAASLDETIDTVDVELERTAVGLIADLGGPQSPQRIRLVFTIVKVNNELERIADAGVTIAEESAALARLGAHLPETIRVIANSLIGILRDSMRALDKQDAGLARIVLSSEDAVEMFKKKVLRDVHAAVATGRMSPEEAFCLVEIATQIEIMAGHCSNIAEQALYISAGEVMKHTGGKWEKFTLPG